MSSLARAVAFTQVYTMPKIVHQYLNLNVAGVLQVTLEIQPIITESLAYLILGCCKYTFELVQAFHQANTASASAGGSFEHQWEANFSSRYYPLSKCAQNGGTREGWQPHLGHCFASGYFVSHERHNRSRGSNKGNMGIRADFCKAGILSEETIPGMDGVCVGYQRSADYIGNIQIALTACTRPDANMFIG